MTAANLDNVGDANPYVSPGSDVDAEEAQSYRPRMLATAGRIGRARYVAYAFVWNLLWLPVAIVVSIVGGGIVANGGSAASDVAALLMFGVLMSGPLVTAFVMARRRLNDLGLSGWLSLMLLAPLVNVPFTLYLLCWPGSPAANRFGPRPLPNAGVVVAAVALLVLVMITGILAVLALSV